MRPCRAPCLSARQPPFAVPAAGPVELDHHSARAFPLKTKHCQFCACFLPKHWIWWRVFEEAKCLDGCGRLRMLVFSPDSRRYPAVSLKAGAV